MSTHYADVKAEYDSTLDLVATMAAKLWASDNYSRHDALEVAMTYYDALICDDGYDDLEELMSEKFLEFHNWE